jgi:transcriptional regulator of heat shock response
MVRTFTQVFPISFGADPEELRKISRQLRRVLENQQRQEELMSTQQEVLDRIQREVAESRAETAETLTAIQSAVAYIQSVPQLVREAVDAALAANPGADLTPLTQLADDLDQQQGQLDQAQLGLNAALSTSQAPPPEIEPVTEPAATDTTGVSGALLSRDDQP